ncbi:MAG TPA: M13 family metallopeptidase, partial [Myxococcota bacterium]|nr:M13 family metallopeptidase [Myxococcota bacterium]
MKHLPSRAALALASAGLAGAAWAASLDLAGLDKGIDPCDDFYGYVNQRWIAANEIPGDRSTWGTAAIVARGNEDMMLELMQASLAGSALPPVGSPERKVLEYFRSGMEEANIRHWQLKPLAPFLGPIAQLGDASALARLIGDLHTRGIRPGFVFGVSPDRKDSTRYIAELGQGGLGLPDRDYYFLDDERSAKIRDAYRAHLARVLRVNGDDEAQAAANAATILALETELARASMTAVERRDLEKTYNKMTMAQLESSAPGFPWKAYFEALGAGHAAELNVRQPAFLARFAQLVAERPIADWRPYLRWHLLRETSTKLDPRYAAPHFDFYERTLRGKTEPPARARHVYDIISGPYGSEPMAEALGRLFVQQRFPPEAKARALELVRNVKAALAERLRRVDWMTEETRARSLAKLAAMRVKIGYPDRWKDLTESDVGARLFVENWMAANIFAHRRDLGRIGKPVDRDEWYMSPHILNAYYSGSLNEIVFPAAILQP